MRTQLFVIGVLAMVSTSLAAQEMPSRRFEGTAATTQYWSSAATPVIDAAPRGTQKRAVTKEEERGALRVGSVVAVASQKRALQWSAAPEGGYVLRVAVRSRDAIGLRVRLKISHLSPGMELRVAARPAAEAQMMSLAAQVAGEIWTPYTAGDTQYIELVLPSGTHTDPSSVNVSVSGAVHFDISPLSAHLDKASGACNPDVSCTSNDAAIDSAIAERKNSVAQLNFVSDGASFLCSGTLINSERFPVAYFVTANHCISTQAAASTITTFWFKETSSCGATALNPLSRQISGGAQLAFTSYNVDSTLLQLNNAPPPGAVYSSWNAAALTVNAPIVALSHPRGDPQKYAQGTFSRLVRTFDYAQDLYGIRYTRGVIESGSSGSGLFTLSGNSLQLRGILSGATTGGGGLSCTNLQDLGVYGRLEIFYPQIKSILETGALPSDDHGNTPATATNLALGGVLNGSISYAGDVDMFRVTVTQSGTLSVNSTGGNDLVGAFLDSQGSGLEGNDDIETRNNEFGISYKVSPGTYYVSVAHFEPGGLATYQVHANFSTASDNYGDIWATATENGWGIALSHQGNLIGGALYTYDSDGSNMWLLLAGAQKQSDGSYVGSLLRFSGPAFDASPWPGQNVVSTPVGTMKLQFLNNQTALMTYTVAGVTVSKTITRFVYDKPPTCSFSAFDRSFTRNYQDIWWTTPESGWGINLIQQGSNIAAALYTYDRNGKAQWLLMGQGVRQTTDTAVTFSGDLMRFTGPAFNAMPWPATAASTKVGTMKFEFTEGHKGKLTYSIDGVQVIKQIERFVFSSPATSCE